MTIINDESQYVTHNYRLGRQWHVNRCGDISGHALYYRQYLLYITSDGTYLPESDVVIALEPKPGNDANHPVGLYFWNGALWSGKQYDETVTVAMLRLTWLADL